MGFNGSLTDGKVAVRPQADDHDMQLASITP